MHATYIGMYEYMSLILMILPDLVVHIGLSMGKVNLALSKFIFCQYNTSHELLTFSIFISDHLQQSDVLV